MSSSPSIPDTVIDNLITRKEIRADAIRRMRARDRIEFKGRRQSFWNKASELNGIAPASKFLIQQKLRPNDFPDHLALIPDGNRRWARSRGLTVGEGYAKGAEVIKDFRKWAMVDNTINVISAFLMSTENIERRPEGELEQLYKVFVDFFSGVAKNDFVHENEIKHEVRGNRDSLQKLPEEVRDSIKVMEESTKNYTNSKLVFLIPYGGRDEIVSAARRTDNPLSESGQLTVTQEGEDKTSFRDNLILGDLPDVDLMIRTSETRLSNFMLYHNAYAEFVFLQKNWPSFTESDFYESIYKYSNRDRRFGV